MLVGDAAHQVNPMSGGGITTAMLAGRIAGGVAAEAIAADDVSDSRLVSYASEWQKQLGKTHERFHKIKQAVYKLTDDDLDSTATAILKYPPEKRTLVNVFKAALIKQPGLLLDVIRLFIGK